MKRNDLEKELKALGATFIEGSKHTKIRLNGKQTIISRQNEIDKILVKAIRKQLDIVWTL